MNTPAPATDRPAEIFDRITIVRDTFGMEIEEVSPTDGVGLLPIGPTTYQATVPIPMGEQMVPVTVKMHGITNIPDAYALIRDKAVFIPMIQEAAQERAKQIRAMQAAQAPRIQTPGVRRG